VPGVVSERKLKCLPSPIAPKNFAPSIWLMLALMPTCWRSAWISSAIRGQNPLVWTQMSISKPSGIPPCWSNCFAWLGSYG